MALILRGNGVVEGLTSLPNNVVTADNLATGAITSSAMPTGSVIQFQNYVVDTPEGGQMLSISDTTWTATTLTINITPKMASSKLYIQSKINYDDHSTTSGGLLTAIYRDGVNLNSSGGYNANTFTYNNPANDNYKLVMTDVYTNSNSTNATTFTLYVRGWNTAALRVASHGGQSTMQIIEIAG